MRVGRALPTTLASREARLQVLDPQQVARLEAPRESQSAVRHGWQRAARVPGPIQTTREGTTLIPARFSRSLTFCTISISVIKIVFGEKPCQSELWATSASASVTERWERFATHILGLVVEPHAPGDTLFCRVDERPSHRRSSGRSRRSALSGWEVADHGTRRRCERLRVAGIRTRLRERSCCATGAQRLVQCSIPTDRDEIFWGRS